MTLAYQERFELAYQERLVGLSGTFFAGKPLAA